MEFILLVIGFTIVLVFILGMRFRHGKPKLTKKTKRKMKQTLPKTTTKTALKSESDALSDEVIKKVATDILKKTQRW